jgi:hypothetical protein
VPDTIIITINGARVAVPSGVTVAAALAHAVGAGCAEPVGLTRRSVTGTLRAPLCGMGVCQECRVTVDSRAHVLACQTLCCAGMQIETAQ